MLKCKNCGADIRYDSNKNTFICDFCNSAYSTRDYKGAYVKIDGKNLSVDEIDKYHYAVGLMNRADSADEYDLAAENFAQISNVFDAEELYKICVQKSQDLNCEKDYIIACQRMTSKNNAVLDTAYEIFIELGDYKDSKQKALECKELQRQNLLQEEKELTKIEKDEKMAIAKEKAKSFFKICGFLLFIALVVGGFLLYKHIDNKKYSRDNVSLNFSAVENDFCVEEGNHYVFNYNVVVENEGKLNIKSIEALVTFEDEDGELIVSTNINLNDYPMTVAAGEKAKFLWELSIYSFDDAEKIFYADKDDLSINVNITKIEFSDGKTMNYDG